MPTSERFRAAIACGADDACTRGVTKCADTVRMSSAEQSVPVVTGALPQDCADALEYFDLHLPIWAADNASKRKLQKIIRKEDRCLRKYAFAVHDGSRITGNSLEASPRKMSPCPVTAILLDPVLPTLDSARRADRLQEILAATAQPTLLQYYRRALWALASLALTPLVSNLTPLPWWAMLLPPLLASAALTIPSKDGVHVGVTYGRSYVAVPWRWQSINLEEASELAAFAATISWDPAIIGAERTTSWRSPLDESDHQQAVITTPTARAVGPGEQRPMQDPEQIVQRVSATHVREALADLLDAWGTYRLDSEAWYLTKPLLHDVTGTVPTTVAYEKALQDLITAVDELTDNSPQYRIDAAAALADAAWKAWHDANDYAAEVGLGDRTPTERANLRKLGVLVERLTHSTTSDPELPSIKRAIQACLDKVSTVSVSWQDIAALPAIEAAGVLPQLTATQLP
ncbi:Uncharacterised protein [Mycobacteroides abscessus subsp. abscessus]|nr:Uncharacterised protein [Mycobacteroides abscessus subsp. abscessus]